MTYDRSEHSCGIIDGKIVVAGGCCSLEAETTSEIFSFDTMTWSVAPGFPTSTGKLRDMGVYQMQDTFYLLGGTDYSETLDIVLEFDQEMSTWKEREEKMGSARRFHGVVPIPRSFPDELEKWLEFLDV